MSRELLTSIKMNALPFAGCLRTVGLGLALCTPLLLASPAMALNVFQVGNSFTFDSMGLNSVVQPIGTEEMLEARLGENVELGYHVRGNTTLQGLWSNPTSAFTTSYGNHSVALPNNAWDFLTLQSFPSIDEPVPTLGEEIARIQDFVTAADQGGGGSTEIIVYTPWAGRGEGSWEDWYEPVPDDPTTRTNYSVAYQHLLYDHVEAAYPGRTRLASAGKVIREVRDRILAGDAPIDETRDLYRDAIHMNNLGSFIASATIQTVILGRSQVGQPVARNAPLWVSPNRISDWQARWAQLVVWEVLLNDPRSGVLALAPGDYDGNGVIDFGDLSVYQQTIGSTERLLADGNGDGVVNASDYDVWFAAVQSSGGISAVAGDFDGDGVVDHADFALFQADYGTTSPSVADGNGDGVVDAIDYTIWRDAFEAGGAGVAVPEPATSVMLVTLAGVSVFRRRVHAA